MSKTKTAIVTGASQGIGAGLVTRFLEKGYNVVGNSRAISTSAAPSPRLALVDGDIGDPATAQKLPTPLSHGLAALTSLSTMLACFWPSRLPITPLVISICWYRRF
jgi:NAD(P)-dependent dehydrogenase (short-subunit alcohol dehydrogenase family)